MLVDIHLYTQYRHTFSNDVTTVLFISRLCPHIVWSCSVFHYWANVLATMSLICESTRGKSKLGGLRKRTRANILKDKRKGNHHQSPWAFSSARPVSAPLSYPHMFPYSPLSRCQLTLNYPLRPALNRLGWTELQNEMGGGCTCMCVWWVMGIAVVADPPVSVHLTPGLHRGRRCNAPLPKIMLSYIVLTEACISPCHALHLSVQHFHRCRHWKEPL